jgi:hypothetical protein
MQTKCTVSPWRRVCGLGAEGLFFSWYEHGRNHHDDNTRGAMSLKELSVSRATWRIFRYSLSGKAVWALLKPV